MIVSSVYNFRHNFLLKAFTAKGPTEEVVSSLELCNQTLLILFGKKNVGKVCDTFMF